MLPLDASDELFVAGGWLAHPVSSAASSTITMVLRRRIAWLGRSVGICLIKSVGS
jgi:hypothetical protein